MEEEKRFVLTIENIKGFILLVSARCRWKVASSSSGYGARLLSNPDPTRYKSKLSLP